MSEVARVKSIMMGGVGGSVAASLRSPIKASPGGASIKNLHHVASLDESNSRQSMAIHLGRAFENFRDLLLCSRGPCFNQATDLTDDDDDDDYRFISHPPFEGTLNEKVARGQDWRLRLEMQAVLCHLEVRWQLFSEALSKFGDLEAMLAVCTDQVRWRRCGKMGPKDAHLSKDLQSLISQKLSMSLRTERITHLLPSGELGSTLDKEGNWGQHHMHDRARTEMALNLLQEKGGDIGDEFAIRLRITQLCVVEDNSYTISDQKGEIVEEGKQVVVWEQHNPTWYIRGCVSYPSLNN